MKSQTILNNLRNSAFAIISLVVLAVSLPAVADTASQVELATGAMMEAIRGNGNFLGADYGPDNLNPLNFNTFVDPSGSAFNYSFSGRYLGKDVTIIGSGQVDGSGKTWNFGSTMQVGRDFYQVNGNQSYTPTETGYSSVMNQYLNNDRGVLPPQQLVNDFHNAADYPWEFPNTSFGGLCFNTFNGQQSGQAWWCGGNYSVWGDFGYWTSFSAAPDFGYSVGIYGTIPMDGGSGNFIESVGSTPEPSTLILLGSSVIGLGGVLRRRLLG